jgi:branched-chain amino acid aminotransferase
MKKTEFVWLDGRFVKWDEARVHVLAHALNYGTGVFEGIRVYETDRGPAVFRLRDHARRLMDGCRMMGIEPEFGGRHYNADDIVETVKEAVRRNPGADYVKPCIFLSGEDVGLNPVNVPVSMAVSCIHMGAYLGNAGTEGAKLITSSWHRPDNHCSPAGAKVNGTYVASCLAKREAVRQGANEAMMLNSTGHVAECTGENIFLCRNGRIYTPAVADSILEGITRNSVIEIARDFGHEVIESQVSRTQLTTADEVWMTGTAAEVVPVTMIDGRPVGDGAIGEVTEWIHTMFHSVALGTMPEYDHWLDYVE